MLALRLSHGTGEPGFGDGDELVEVVGVDSDLVWWTADQQVRKRRMEQISRLGASKVAMDG